MQVENTLRTAKIKVSYMIMLANIVALSVYNIFEYNKDWVEWIIWSIVILLAVGYLAMLALFKLDFFFLEDKNGKLIFRFYAAHPIARKYKSFELSGKYLMNYRIKKSLGGLKKELYMTAKTPKGVFNFPPMSLSLMNKNETESLKYILGKHSKQ